MRAVIRGEYLDVPQQADAVLFASNRWLENKLRQNENLCADWLWMHSRWRHQDNVARRFRLESKHNLLAGQLAALGETTLPRRTRFFIRLPNWLGDVVMALPLLRALRLSRPDAELTLLTQPAFVPLLERLGVGDRCIALPPQDTAYFGLFWEMRHEYPDTHILFTNSVRGDFEARVAGAPQRFGMVRPGLSRPLLTHSWVVPADLDETKEHQTRVWEKFFQNFGLKQELDLTSFQWSAPATEPAPHHTAPVIGFICGTENTPEKRWPVEHWRELANAILGAHPAARIQLFGTSRDAAITAAVAEGFPPERVVNRAGKTTLLEFAEALSGCAAIVCNDTGGMHLANALGVPVIAVYGPTNPIRTGPIFDGTHIILQPPGCPPTGGAPLASLSVAPVLAAVEATLARSRG